MSEERIVAVILAGGRSSRFGAPKALAVLAGKPLIAHVAQALAGAAQIAVVGDAAAAEAIGAPCLMDPPDVASGPLAGVRAGLEWALARSADWLCVAPCDAPLLPPDVAARLRDAAGDERSACAETVTGDEPLISIWHVSQLPGLRAALADGAHPRVTALLSAARLRLSSLEAINVNTREDFARAEAVIVAKA